MKVVQINSVCGYGSTGRITIDISRQLSTKNIENYIFYGVGESNYPLSIKVGNTLNVKSHQIGTRVLGKHGFYSRHSTYQLVKKLEELDPDIVHLHNLHGHYLNVDILFEYLAKANKKVIWTLHDCWSFTGHCTHFEFVKCNKWIEGCTKCPQLKEYPKSLIFDRSKESYIDKKRLFTSIKDLTIVTPSNWLASLVKESFLKNYPVKVIPNGINLVDFKPSPSKIREKMNLKDKFIILGVASFWDERKGFLHFLKLSENLPEDYKIILIGLNAKQIESLPKNITGIERTENIEELVEYYSTADIFVNPTLEDTFPTVNLESLACGTPVITFNSGGSPEAIDKTCGMVIDKGNIEKLVKVILDLKLNNFNQSDCVKRSEIFNKEDKYLEYLKLYNLVFNEV